MKIQNIVYAVLFFTPLILIPGLTQGFELPKLIVLQIGVLLMLFVFTRDLFKKKKLKIFDAFKNRSVKRILFIVLVLIIASAVFSIAPRLSFWGSFYRLLGAHTYFFMILFFFLISFSFHKKELWDRAYSVLMVSTVITILYGIFQFVELDIFGYNIEEISLGRIFSSLGHPTYFAAFIVMTVFPIWAHFIANKRPRNTYIFGALVLIGLILSGSRTALVAFLIGTAIFLLLLAIKRKKKAKLIGASSILLVILISLGILSTQIDSRNVENPMLQRFVVNDDDRSLISRTLIWKPALQVAQDNIIFGHGWETFPYAYAKEMNSDIYMVERLNSIPDKAHNSVIEIMVENGLFGLLAYIFAIVATFYLGVKALLHTTGYKKIYLTGLLTSFLACIMMNMLGFFSIIHFIYLAFFYANFLFLISNKIIERPFIISKKSLRIGTSIFLALFIGAELILQNIFPLVSNYYASVGIANAQNKDIDGAIKNLTIASAVYPDQSQYYYLLAELQMYLKNTDQALYNLEKAGRFVSYQDSYYYMMKGKIHSIECQQDQEKCLEADLSYQTASELAPNYPFIYLNWGVFHLNNDDCDQAVEKFQKYLEIAPDFWKNPESEEARLFYKHNPDFNNVFGMAKSCGTDLQNNYPASST